METTTALLVAAGTLAVGVLVGWLWHALRASTRGRSAEMESVRLHAELDTARREAASLHEQLESARADGERRLAQAAQESERRLEQVRADAERQVAEVKGDQERAAQQFRSLAGEVLSSSNKEFLALAEQRLRASTVKNDETLAQREQSFRALLDPLSKTMEKVNLRVDEAERARTRGQSTLTEQLRHLEAVNSELRTGTNDLVAALRSNQTRGMWGELQLKRVVEAAGMLDHVDFDVQVHVRNAEGEALIPDLVVNLAGGKNVVVDSKVPLSAYLKAQSVTDRAEVDRQLDAHARDVLKHVEVLAGKAYWSQFDAAPEFVVLFVPAEPILAAAVERKPDLLEVAARKNVLVATPMTLIAMLRTVGYAWQQEAIAEDAQKVLQVGKELYSRIVTMTDKVTKLGQSMTTATKRYNEFVGSLETRVLPQARRMIELKVVDTNNAIEPLKVVEETTRPITKAELLAADEGGIVAIDTIAVDGPRDDVDELVESDRRAVERAAAERDGRGDSASSSAAG
ncbi:DNA recombination protein RmuC [Isoptericola aurantiacus]|uniref:DNA recombination protein RmuC n=1 Tax=Isoptericola aurantiacus TaxID=3377839 RepID=UPI00383B9B3E